jgi:hypothetical protein
LAKLTATSVVPAIVPAFSGTAAREGERAGVNQGHGQLTQVVTAHWPLLVYYGVEAVFPVIVLSGDREGGPHKIFWDETP